MPELQLPIFPAGMTEINDQVAIEKREGTMWDFHGHTPVFQHAVQDLLSFRMFTSQTIGNGTVKPKQIAETFGVPMITAKRYVKLYRERDAKGLHAPRPRQSSASVLKGEVLERVQQ